MAISQNITPLSTPPSRSDPTNFDSRADTFLAELPTLATQINTWAGQANSTATTTNSDASAAATAKTNAETAEAHAETAQGLAEAARDTAIAQASTAAASAATATSQAASALASATSAGASAATAQAAAANAAAVVTGGTATLTPTAGKIPLAGADGRIDSAWLRTASNDIGTPGQQGFGVGICPDLPAGFSLLSGTTDPASANYGNYQYQDGSIMCWIPAFYYRVAHASNPTYGTYGVNSVDVKHYSHFGNVAAANTAGYALHRAFYDGTEQPGFFIDKYLGSNSLGANASGGTFSSLALGIPCDTDGSQSGVGAIAGCGGTNNYGMVQTACRSRGATFHSASLFMHKALALLALAHAQAATATTWCAWYDAAGTTNFPKGCNNNALGDAHDASVAYLTAGHGTYPNKPLTGSATAPAKVAHNGQGSGVMDLNGAMWEVAYGLTSDATNYYGLKPSKRLRGLTGANTTGADSLFGATGIAANYDDYGTSIGVVGGSAASTFFGSASQVLAADTSGEGWFATGAGIPLAEGGSNLFGSDGLWDYRPNELCPLVGADWYSGSYAGVWALYLYNVRGLAVGHVGGRAALFL